MKLFITNVAPRSFQTDPILILPSVGDFRSIRNILAPTPPC